MADNKDNHEGPAGAEDPKPDGPKPAGQDKTAATRRRSRASKAQRDKTPDGKTETAPAPVDQDSDHVPQPQPKPLSMRIRALGVGLVLAIVVGAGAWFTVTAWLDRPGEDGLGGQLRSLERMVDDLEGKLGEAEKRLAGKEDKELAPALSPAPPPGPVIIAPPPPAESAVPAPEAPSPEMREKLPGESDRLTVTVDDLSGRLETLEQQLKSATQTPPSAPSPQMPPILALLDFHTAMARGAPFSAELAILERSFAGDRAALASLAPLKPWSGRGVATVARLQSLLNARIPAILRAARPPVDDSGPWLKRNWARSWERLRALVVIRRVGEDVPGIAPDAIIARAEAILAKDDIAGAVAELSALEGAPMLAAKDWLAQARARLAAEQALAAITGRMAPRPAVRPAPDDKVPAVGGGDGGRR